MFLMQEMRKNKKIMNYKEVCDYIEGIVRFTAKHSNVHTRKCLELLGNPDHAFQSIHIAGTNGKGSTCAFLAAVLNKAGCRTGLFVSPHLIRINERIQFMGREITDEQLISVFNQVRSVAEAMEASGEGHPSYFEFLFLMAMVYFAEQKAEICVIETGLGGRLDATNALDHVALSVITAIGMDHMQYLGHSLKEIAKEKAGIIRSGVPCVYSANASESAEVIRSCAESLQAPSNALTKDDYEVEVTDQGMIDFLTSFRYDELHRYHTSARGTYQAENGALAVLALKVLKETQPSLMERVTEQAVREGVEEMYWPGRMEQVAPHVYLDGAHNDNGIRRFIESVREITHGEAADLVFAVVNDKDFTDMVHDLAKAQRWKHVYVTEAGGERKTDADAIAALFYAEQVESVEVIRDPMEACRTAIQRRSGSETVFVCGSLYLIGTIREMLQS